MTEIATVVTYVTEDDLIDAAKLYNVEQIDVTHLKDFSVVLKSNVLILKFKGRYKLLKSRY